MRNNLAMADFYEDRAENLRRLASNARDDSAKRDLTLLALEYEHLAQHARRLLPHSWRSVEVEVKAKHPN